MKHTNMSEARTFNTIIKKMEQKEQRKKIFITIPIAIVLVIILFIIPSEYQKLQDIVFFIMVFGSISYAIIYTYTKNRSKSDEPSDLDENELFEAQVKRMSQKKKRTRLLVVIVCLLMLSLIFSSVIGYSGFIGITFQLLLAFIMTAGCIFLLYSLLFRLEIMNVIGTGFCCAALLIILYLFGAELCNIGLDIVQGPTEMVLNTYTVSYQSGTSTGGGSIGNRITGGRGGSAIGGNYISFKDQEGNHRKIFLPGHILHKLDKLKLEGSPDIIIQYFERMNAVWDITSQK